jgi:tetratricopeptide (TPR) repeat protein
VESVLDICAGLPLALDIVAHRLASRPNWSLRTLAERLADQHHRLDELLAGDLAVRVSFVVSYDAIGADTDPGRRLFRLLGLVDAATLGLPAVAALAGRSHDATRRAIEGLVDVHLVESPAPFRYRLHDLLGVYAAERARAEEPNTERDAALRRLLTYYLHTTQMTALKINPHRRRPPLEPPGPDIEITEFADHQTAFAWLDTEFDNLMAAVRLAHDRGWYDIAWKLPMAMWDLSTLRGHRHESIELLQIALTSARQLNEPDAVPWVLNNLAVVLASAGRSGEAVTTLRSALPLARELGDRRLEATILANLGDGLQDLEEFGSAIEALEQALVIFQEMDVPASVAITLCILGSVEYRCGRLERSLDRYRQGLATSRDIGDDYGHAQALGGMSEVMRDLNRLDQAATCARESVELNRRTGHRAEEAYGLLILSDTLARRGEVEQARCHWREAVAILKGTPDAYLVKLRDSIAGRWQLVEPGS